MSIGSRIKERREAIGMKQEELAAILGVSKGAIGNYEADYNLPKATMIIPIAQALKTDPNYLFQDGFTLDEDTFSEDEKMIIKKYRALGEHGKKIVDTILNIEYEECSKSSWIVPDIMTYTKTDKYNAPTKALIETKSALDYSEIDKKIVMLEKSLEESEAILELLKGIDTSLNIDAKELMHSLHRKKVKKQSGEGEH